MTNTSVQEATATSRIDLSYPAVLRLVTPVLLTQYSFAAMGVIDTMMVGRLGVLELGAVGFGNLLTWWFLSFFHGNLQGVNTFVAQAYGAGDDRRVGVYLWQGVYLAVASAVVIGLVVPLVSTVFAWTGASAEMIAVAGDYARIRLLGALGLTLLVVAEGFYRGVGRTDIPMWCVIAQLALNCGLNYLLIFGKLGLPALGVSGAALGTVVSQMVIASTLLGGALLNRRWRNRFSLASAWRPSLPALRTMVAVSLPIGIQVFMEMGGVSVFTAIVARLGELQMAATNAVINAWSLGYTTAFALAAGVATLVGHCLGAGRPSLARRAVTRVSWLGSVVIGLIGLLYLLAPEQLMAMFVERGEIGGLLPYARPLFLVAAVCLVFDLRLNLTAGALRGAGDTRYPMLVNVGSAWLVFVPLLLFTAQRYGVVGAWWCFAVHVGLTTLLLEFRYRGTAWMKRVIDSEDAEEAMAPAAGPAVSGAS